VWNVNSTSGDEKKTFATQEAAQVLSKPGSSAGLASGWPAWIGGRIAQIRAHNNAWLGVKISTPAVSTFKPPIQRLGDSIGQWQLQKKESMEPYTQISIAASRKAESSSEVRGQMGAMFCTLVAGRVI
jgi:hypothetical protein